VKEKKAVKENEIEEEKEVSKPKPKIPAQFMVKEFARPSMPANVLADLERIK